MVDFMIAENWVPHRKWRRCTAMMHTIPCARPGNNERDGRPVCMPHWKANVTRWPDGHVHAWDPGDLEPKRRGTQRRAERKTEEPCGAVSVTTGGRCNRKAKVERDGVRVCKLHAKSKTVTPATAETPRFITGHHVLKGTR